MKSYVIRNGDLFWRPNRSGYTSQLCEAGLYSEEEAKRQAAIRREDEALSLEEAMGRLRPNLEILSRLWQFHKVESSRI